MPFLYRSFVAAFYLILISMLTGCAAYTLHQAATQTPQSGTLVLSASSFDFKTVVIGQTGTQTLQLTNTGTAPVKITALALADKQFTVTGTPLPATVAPSASVSYTLAFSPTAAGANSASLNITSTAPVSPQAVSLTGSGEKAFASLVVTPASLNFGNQTVKTTTTQSVTLQNSGDVSLTIQSVALSGKAFNYSNLANGVAIAPNQQVTFLVSFDPTATGAESGSISFAGPGLNSPGTLSLSGSGVNATAPTPTPPPTPQQHKVRLTWDASPSKNIGYLVYRSETSGGTYNPLFGTAINKESYEDTNVTPGTTYYYVVTTVDASGVQSVYSNQAGAVVP